MEKITRVTANGKPYVIYEDDRMKTCSGADYKFAFNKSSGFFVRWGEKKEDDPSFSPVGPEIWDCECTTICKGVPNSLGAVFPCAFCYKSNGLIGKNLSFSDFKKMIDSFPPTLTQVAFGSDSEAKSNPELWNMMDYCRKIGVIPNITVANVSSEVAANLKKYCGAVAVSRYGNKDICYSSVDKLTNEYKMPQINIHAMLSEQTYDWCMETAMDQKRDPRLRKMNAIVFLGVKPKGRAKGKFDSVSFQKFETLINYCLDNQIRFGFDSCSANRFISVVKNSNKLSMKQKEQMMTFAEPCESALFSFYTNVDGKFFPCSFTEGEEDWINGLDMLNVKSFHDDIWYNPKTIQWRNRLILSGENCNSCRQCLSFPEIN